MTLIILFVSFMAGYTDEMNEYPIVAGIINVILVSIGLRILAHFFKD